MGAGAACRTMIYLYIFVCVIVCVCVGGGGGAAIVARGAAFHINGAYAGSETASECSSWSSMGTNKAV